ncbi:MAG TPA: NADH:flavin oxidoreductase, partial [Acidimicrobiales bacterium]|nr:NADH:flavin oxidoreductase [Acidimicrobiales bacterium]
MTIRQIKRLTAEDAFRDRLGELGVDLPLDTDRSPGGPLAEPLAVPGTGKVAGNRFCILPMEGWDGSAEGAPTELVTRRWRRFGESGAKLIWGGEAVAVRHDGRANSNQLVVGDGLGDLRRALVDAHVDRYGTADDLVVGLQLTHSGRWSRPDGVPAPRPAHAHPVLDGHAPGEPLTDGELDALRDDFVAAARVAHR